MSKDEFEDLKNFGKTIEIKPKQKKVEDKNQLVIKKTKFEIKKFLKVILVKICKALILFFKKLLEGSYRLSSEIKRKYENWNIKKQSQSNKCYKIVETKKQRRNKVIIIRKRVPAKYVSNNLVTKDPNIGALFYLSIKDKEDGGIETSSENYTSLKESVWDFPIKKRK